MAAIARALCTYAKRPLDVATLTRAAGASETLVHGTPSGVDGALAIAGGTGVFRRSTGLAPLGGVPPLRILVGPSSVPRSTAAMIERVAEATGSQRNDPRLRELGALPDSGTAALLAADLPTLGGAMDRAYRFREIGRVRVVEAAELAAMKAIAIAARKGQEKGLSDRLDLHRLLRAFPDLRAENGPVPARLVAL